MTISALKKTCRDLRGQVLRLMEFVARSTAQIEILQDKVNRQAKLLQDTMAQSRQRGDELQRLRRNEEMLQSSIKDTARERGIKEDLAQQINKLAHFIITAIPGEPSKSEGAIDTAIRLLQAHVVNPAVKAAARAKDPNWSRNSVRLAMAGISEILNRLPEKEFLRKEPMQLVVLRALKRMYANAELHKSYDTTVGRLVEAEERLQLVVETLQDALVGHKEFNDHYTTVEFNAARCIKRLALDARCVTRLEMEKAELKQQLEAFKSANARLRQTASEKTSLAFTTTDRLSVADAKLSALTERVAAEVKGRRDSNAILFEALRPGVDPMLMDSTENPVFYANRAAETIRVIRTDNMSLRKDNELLKKVNGFPHNGTCILEGSGRAEGFKITLVFCAGHLVDLSVNRDRF